MHVAFISYPLKKQAVTNSVCSSLEAAGLACWIAPRDIRPASDWSEAIVNALGNSQLIIVVFSAAANDSGGVRNEVALADARGLPILLFRVEDAEPGPRMEYFLRAVQWLDAFRKPIDVHLAELVDAVQTLAVGEEAVEHPVNAERSAENEAVLLDAADAEDAAAATTLGLRARERGDHDEACRWFSTGAEGATSWPQPTWG